MSASALELIADSFGPDFNGVLGLAWQGFTTAQNTIGGVCELDRVGGISYNCAVSTGNSFAAYVSPLIYGHSD